MNLREWRRELRVVVAAHDVEAVLHVLDAAPPRECLQEVGEALAGLALVDDLRVIAERTASELRRRGWTGDEELAEELGGGGQQLRPTVVDLEALGEVLDGPAGSVGVLDLETGFAWTGDALEAARDAGVEVPEGADGSRSLAVVAEGYGGRDMREFVSTVPDPHLADRLRRSIGGRGASRRFRGALERDQSELSRWHAFRDDRSMGRARAWLAEAGYRPERAKR